MLWSNSCNFFWNEKKLHFQKKSQVLDQVHFKKIYNDWIRLTLVIFLTFFEKNHNNWIKCKLPKSKFKWTGLPRFPLCLTNRICICRIPQGTAEHDGLCSGSPKAKNSLHTAEVYWKPRPNSKCIFTQKLEKWKEKPWYKPWFTVVTIHLPSQSAPTILVLKTWVVLTLKKYQSLEYLGHISLHVW